MIELNLLSSEKLSDIFTNNMNMDIYSKNMSTQIYSKNMNIDSFLDSLVNKKNLRDTKILKKNTKINNDNNYLEQRVF